MDAEGYSKLARLLDRYPEVCSFRKFGYLQTKILLYLQAELSHLEFDLSVLAKEDLKYDLTKVFEASWEELSSAGSEKAADEQKNKVEEITTKLERYSRVNAQPKPNARDVECLRTWLMLPSGGNGFLKGVEAEPWSRENEGDLIAQKPATPRNALEDLLDSTIFPLYHRYLGRRVRPKLQDQPDLGPIWHYSELVSTRLVNLLSLVLSSLIPTLSICLLYHFSNMGARFMVSTIMTFLFSFTMMEVIGGKRSEVFAATAAFAAIQVVFIGGVTVVEKH